MHRPELVPSPECSKLRRGLANETFWENQGLTKSAGCDQIIVQRTPPLYRTPRRAAARTVYRAAMR